MFDVRVPLGCVFAGGRGLGRFRSYWGFGLVAWGVSRTDVPERASARRLTFRIAGRRRLEWRGWGCAELTFRKEPALVGSPSIPRVGDSLRESGFITRFLGN